MTALIGIFLVLAAVVSTLVIRITEPARQAACLGAYGLILSLLFVVLQAPDVALSELVVGGIGLPAMILVAAARTDDGGRGGG
jgi:energy-converting hydrogenase B subunit D